MSDQIKSRPQTLEYDAGHDRVFGEREPGSAKGGRWVYRPVPGGGIVAVPAHLAGPLEEPGRVYIATDRHYEGVAATDGTDIGSRRKRREYMRVHGLADADDYKNTWAKDAAERARSLAPGHDSRARKEAVALAMREVQAGRGNRRRERAEDD